MIDYKISNSTFDIERYKRIYWRKRKPLSKKDLEFFRNKNIIIKCKNTAKIYFPTIYIPERTEEIFGKLFLVYIQKHWGRMKWAINIITLKETFELDYIDGIECKTILDGIFEKESEPINLSKFVLKDQGMGKIWMKENGLY